MSTLSVGTIKSNTTSPPAIQNSSGTQIGTFCRAWVNFNGTGTVAIRQSFNVSSITDIATGQYTVNFTTALADANYCFVAAAQETAADASSDCPNVSARYGSTVLAGSLELDAVTATGQSFVDSSTICVAIFR